MSMLIKQTLEKLRALKLRGMAEAFEQQLASPAAANLAFEDRVGLLVDAEATFRENQRLKRLLKEAKLRESACLEDVDYRPERGLDRSLMASLELCKWVQEGINLIITGPTGTGKTWLASAFGNQACRKGMSAQCHRLPILLEELSIAHGDGSLLKRLTSLGKFDLLILDDFGMSTLTATNRAHLLELIDQRTGRRATVITSQIPVDRWHDYLSGDNPTLADAILDRLVSGSYRIPLKGESMRMLRARTGRAKGGTL